MMDKELLDWIINNRLFLNTEQIAAAVGMPGGVLRNFLLGAKPLPDKHRGALLHWLTNFVIIK